MSAVNPNKLTPEGRKRFLEEISQNDFGALSRETLLALLEKALLRLDQPSCFFETLRARGQLGCWFPEVQALIGVEQNPVHHPEGDVWNHTMRVLDQAALLRGRAENPFGLMLSALCHDFGKAVTTETVKGRIHAYGHEVQGIAIAKAFLSRLTEDEDLCAYAANMVWLHMRPNLLAEHGSSTKLMQAFDASVCPGDLLLLVKADRLGMAVEQDYTPTERILRRRLSRYRKLMQRPQVTEEELSAAGLTGKALEDALRYARSLHLVGQPKARVLDATVAYIRSQMK